MRRPTWKTLAFGTGRPTKLTWNSKCAPKRSKTRKSTPDRQPSKLSQGARIRLPRSTSQKRAISVRACCVLNEAVQRVTNVKQAQTTLNQRLNKSRQFLAGQYKRIRGVRVVDAPFRCGRHISCLCLAEGVFRRSHPRLCLSGVVHSFRRHAPLVPVPLPGTSLPYS